MYDLQTFESQNIFPLPVELYNISPTVPQSFDKINVSQLPEKEIEVSLDEKDLTALLTADITDNKKLSLSSLEYFQSVDPLIANLKDTLQGNHQLKSFIIKKRIVCKLFKIPNTTVTKPVIYLPTVLLKPTIVYIHKHFLHCSKTQTFKQFSQLYYHPKAKATISKLCDACITCKISRNPEHKNVPVGKVRSFFTSLLLVRVIHMDF
jgi:hypothetical protein